MNNRLLNQGLEAFPQTQQYMHSGDDTVIYNDSNLYFLIEDDEAIDAVTWLKTVARQKFNHFHLHYQGLPEDKDVLFHCTVVCSKERLPAITAALTTLKISSQNYTVTTQENVSFISVPIHWFYHAVRGIL